MHRVELKACHNGYNPRNKHSGFLMHRVELKGYFNHFVNSQSFDGFLMHRVELKALHPMFSCLLKQLSS